MTNIFHITVCILMITATKAIDKGITKGRKELSDHTMVIDSETFPYVVAILKKTTYISAGALIDESWVLTAADALFLVRESSRNIRVRLGSINNKKGGVLMPIKFFHIHPYFDDNKPRYDIALIRLSSPVKFTPNLHPISLQKKLRRVTATHFIVTGWQTHFKVAISDENLHQEPMEEIKRRRLLSVSHLHPTDPEECSEQLAMSGLNYSRSLMCLDLAAGTSSCDRQTGAPVVLNDVLWGIISSWKPDDCDVDSGPSFVTLVSARDVSSWIHATRLGKKWGQKKESNFKIKELEEKNRILLFLLRLA